MNARKFIDELIENLTLAQRLAQAHNKLYAQLDGVLKRHNPCKISGGECEACRKTDNQYARPGDVCCNGCKHHDPKRGGCQTKSLSCKSWLCKHVERSPEFEKEWEPLKKKVWGSGLANGVRTTRMGEINMASRNNPNRYRWRMLRQSQDLQRLDPDDLELELESDD